MAYDNKKLVTIIGTKESIELFMQAAMSVLLPFSDCEDYKHITSTDGKRPYFCPLKEVI